MASVSGERDAALGRCLPYGEGITFWPLADVVKQAAGITPGLSAEATKERLVASSARNRDASEIAARLAALLGATDVRRRRGDILGGPQLLEALARERPVVVSSKTCIGPSRRSSTSSTTWPSGRATRRS